MPATTPHLLTLIRLLEGTLSDSEGAAVRERLAVDPGLREHCRLLTEVLEAPVSLDDLDRLDDESPETISAFVDGRLTPDEAARFEAVCWQSPASLREVVEAYRATCESPVEVEIPHTARLAMARIVAAETQVQPASTPVNGIRRNGQKPRSINGQAPPPVRQAPPIVEQTGSRRRLTIVAILSAAAVAVIVATVAFFAGRNGANRDDAVTDDTHDREHRNKSVNDNLPHHPNRKQPAPPDLVPNPPHGSSGRNPAIAKRPSKRDNSPKNLPPQRKQPVFATLEYPEVHGVAGRRDDRASKWKGVLFPDESAKNDAPVTLRTLPAGWLRARFSSGLEFVMSDDTEVRIASRKRTDADASDISLDVRRGRIAILGMRKGDRIRFRVPRGDGVNDWTIRSLAKASSVGFIRDDDAAGEVVVWDGEMDLGSRKLPSGRSVRWNSSGPGSPTRPMSRHAWRTKPQQRSVLRKALAARLNRSGDLQRALLAAPRNANPREVLLQTRFAFSLDPVTAVPRASASKHEPQRMAAVMWLLKADPNQRQTAEVWRGVFRVTGPAATRVSLRSWYAAAARRQQANNTMLRKLAAGLNSKQPIFIRQSAIFFFRQITRQPLRDYDPDRPTKAAIDKVIQATRRVIKTRRPNRRN